MKFNSYSLIQNKNFIIFGEDYDRHPHSLEHLLKPLFDSNKFIWVETIGLRSPKLSFYDFKRAIEIVSKWFKPEFKSKVKKTPPNVTIISPFMIPYNQFFFIRAFNKWNVIRNVNKAIQYLLYKNCISISSVPQACDYIGHFHESLKIYYCVDEFSLWPGYDLTLVSSMEQKLIKKSNLILATSQTLLESKSKLNKNTHLLTHGVDFQHFNIGSKKISTNPTRVCYFGLFDERSDQNILLKISENIKNIEIHIIGKVVCDTSTLKCKPNIIFHGPIQYNALPDFIQSMDIFILPYRISTLTEFINPLKLKEYISTGRPVIATGLPEVLKLRDYLFIANSAEEFITTITDIRTDKLQIKHQKTLSYIQENETWSQKAKELSYYISKNLFQFPKIDPQENYCE